MNAAAELLRMTEAAVVSRVSPRDVNRVIDEHILPSAFVSWEGGRRVQARACTLISFYYESASRLTADERLLTIRRIGGRMDEWFADDGQPSVVGRDWVVQDGFLAVDFAPFVRQTEEGMSELKAARDMVQSVPDILGGFPVIRGTRIPVYDVAASAAAGASTDTILAAYPSLTARQIHLAHIYAQANPPRGRPRASRNLPAGSGQRR